MFKKLLLVAALTLVLPGALWAQDEAAPQVKLETSQGDIVIELNPQAAPETVKNFLAYVKSGHYDGTIFHRVIANFMIQGGGFTSEMKEKATGAPIKNEANNGLKNDKYTIAMARTPDPHSATAQFFINVGEANEFLNFKEESAQGWGYAVFGKVVSGQEVVDAIAKVQTGQFRQHGDVPVKPIVINKAAVL
ncbi:MAG: peptidyl-prolyl cis-trans isomerase [Candidatus Adiutrix sp.]|nr:peptidyl-prolyl cis-trans isomerase [Candidatus Adiutrix sp.]